MKNSIYVSALVMASLTSARGIPAGDLSHLSKRAQVPDNVDLWTVSGNQLNPGGNINSQSSPDGLPSPGDVVFQSDGSCDFSKSGTHFEGSQRYSLVFCNQNTAVVYGAPLKISADIDCSGLQGCSTTHTNSITASSTFSITGSVSFNGDIAKVIKATATLGGSKAWTDSTTATDAFTFTPKPGSKGHMVFFPYMYKACGPTYITKDIIVNNEPQPQLQFLNSMDIVDCGLTPLTLSNGQPDGIYSFCDANTNQGCGPSAPPTKTNE